MQANMFLRDDQWYFSYLGYEEGPFNDVDDCIMAYEEYMNHIIKENAPKENKSTGIPKASFTVRDFFFEDTDDL